MPKKYFGTDGIRGRVNQGNINGEMFFGQDRLDFVEEILKSC